MSMSTATGNRVSFTPGRFTAEQYLSDDGQRSTAMALVASAGVLIAVYWNMFTLTKDYWNDDTYSHGWMIPFMAMFLMWTQRTPRGGPVSREQENQNFIQVGVPLAVAIGCYFVGLYAKLPIFYSIGWVAYATSMVVALWVVFRDHKFETYDQWERWVGVGLIVASLLIRIFAAQTDAMPLDRLCFIVSLYGVFLLAGGLALVKRMWASIGFFIFMFPLPSAIENNALLFLQKLAAVVSTVVLQVLGIVAHRQGNNIIIDGLADPLEVAQACSGLRMLTIFCAMSIALVLLVERPWWDKLILLLSAVPIALATNIIRITITALLFTAVEGTSMQEHLHGWIHDYAGYAMILIAGGIMWLEYKILTWLFVEEGDDTVQAVGILGRGQTASR